MNRVKLIYYKPFEYQLLQDLLDHMSSEGYEAKKLHFISFFRKTNQPHHYIVDCFHTNKRSYYDKMIEEERFLDPYKERGYTCIYNKKDIYVFKGNQKIPYRPKEKNVVTSKFITNSFSLFCLTLAVTFLFVYFSYDYMNINTFLTYGRTILYIGLLTLCLGLCFRFFMNTILSLKQKKNALSKKSARFYHFIEVFIISFAIFFMIGGFIEDDINATHITIDNHQIITLNDLGIRDKSELQYIRKKSFQVPTYYDALEYTENEQYILYTKVYQFKSSSQAKEIWKDFSKNPQLYSCNQIKKEDHVIYGYLDQQLSSLIIQQNQSVILISFNFNLNQDQIQQIFQFYKV